MENNVLNKNFVMVTLVTLITFSGCAGMFVAGVPINADKNYPEFIGIKLMPLQPAAIIKNDWGIAVHIPYTIPYGELVAKIPDGTVITIEHVIRTYNVKNEVGDTIMGRIDVPGYSGLVAVATCNGKEQWTIERCINSSKYKVLPK